MTPAMKDLLVGRLDDLDRRRTMNGFRPTMEQMEADKAFRDLLSGHWPAIRELLVRP